MALSLSLGYLRLRWVTFSIKFKTGPNYSFILNGHPDSFQSFHLFIRHNGVIFSYKEFLRMQQTLSPNKN